VSQAVAVLAGVGTWLRAALTENAALKAVAFAVALALFVVQHGQQDQQERTIQVGLVWRVPPEDAMRVLMTPRRPSVDATLRGTGRAVNQLLETGVTPIELDLRDGQKKTVPFEPRMFSLPAGVEIVLIDPPSLELEWQDVVTREIPLQASITGQPRDEYTVKGKPVVEPERITVKGPQSLVETLQYARLAAFDVTGLTEGVYRRPVSIDPPPEPMRWVEAPNAWVTVTIARRVTEAKFAKLPVEVVGVPGGKPVPRTVDVTVIGPPEVVRALRAEQIVPRVDVSKAPGIDLATQKHGSATLPVNVSLAHADTEIQPPVVTVKW
jgi:hypothetical protein